MTTFLRLTGSLSQTTTTYKFYWLLAITEEVSDYCTSFDYQYGQHLSLSIRQLLNRKVALAWYPLHQGIHFGNQDQLAAVVYSINSNEKQAFKPNIPVNILMRQLNDHHWSRIKPLGRFVPYRFLTPWFSEQLRRKPDQSKNALLLELAKNNFGSQANGPPYKIANEDIEIHSDWVEYIFAHRAYLRSFINFNLLTFLQRRNPNGIQTTSLETPNNRMLETARRLWKSIAAQSNADFRCFYSQETLASSKLSLDHFIPWDLVSADHIWNLVPTTRSINSQKSNRLPDTTHYLDRLVVTQWKVFEFFLSNQATISSRDAAVLLGAYFNLLGVEAVELESVSESTFKKSLKKRIERDTLLGLRCGLPSNWYF